MAEQPQQPTAPSAITITLVHAATGQSESIPLAASTTVQELKEWSCALFGILDDSKDRLQLLKDGNVIPDNGSDSIPTAAAAPITLKRAGIRDGDLIAVATTTTTTTSAAVRNAATAAVARAVAPTSSSLNSATGGSGGGGLDFSALLAANSSSSQQQQPSSSTASAAAASSATAGPEPVYYPNMNLEEAQQANPHPEVFCRLLLRTEHLQRELNYYNPALASRLLAPGTSLHQATTLWREAMIKVRHDSGTGRRGGNSFAAGKTSKVSFCFWGLCVRVCACVRAKEHKRTERASERETAREICVHPGVLLSLLLLPKDDAHRCIRFLPSSSHCFAYRASFSVPSRCLYARAHNKQTNK
jgi:hypothetical protein